MKDIYPKKINTASSNIWRAVTQKKNQTRSIPNKNDNRMIATIY